jgi:putative transposon-encoded protein
MAKMSVTIEAYQAVEKVVGKGGTSGVVYVPKSWEGCKVQVLLIEPVKD